MSEKAKRHDWRPGPVQHCGNVGCPWKRRNKPTADGYAATARQYSSGGVLETWGTETRVPPCEGTR